MDVTPRPPETGDPASPPLVDLVTEIVSAYVSHNRVQRAELSDLISGVHEALAKLSAPPAAREPAADQRKVTPAEIRRSITPDFLTSFEDGKRYKTLRRHLSTRGLTPEQYREKWGLPVDYPTAAPNYSKQRSDLAKAIGLGERRRAGLAKVSDRDALKVDRFEEEAAGPAPEAPAKAAPKRAPRRKKAESGS